MSAPMPAGNARGGGPGRPGGPGTATTAGGRAAVVRRHAEIDVRGLLERREYIKTTVYLLPRRTKIQILELMDRLRRARWRPPKDRRGASPPRLPEMTAGELVREINWRIGTLPPADAMAVAAYVKRVTGWRRARARLR
jgi:hypothetical protein